MPHLGANCPLIQLGWPELYAFGMYSMYALQESVRQMRGTTAAQIEDAKISVCHRVVGMFAASGTIELTNESA